MKPFKKVGIFWFLFLIFYCVFLISIILFLCQLVISIIFFFSDGQFLFVWKYALYLAVKKGSVAGLILGVGLWLKGWLYARKMKKTNEKNTKSQS